MENTEEWKQNKTTGEIGESIVKNILESTNEWTCIKFGIENHIEELKKKLKDNLTEGSRKIRSMPDFIAINEKTQEVILVEAKYRTFIDRRDPSVLLFEFGYNKIMDYLTFWKDAKMVIVTPQEPFFYVVDLKDVKIEHFHGRRKNESNNQNIEQWNFKDIQKPITSLLPNLSDEALKKAVDLWIKPSK